MPVVTFILQPVCFLRPTTLSCVIPRVRAEKTSVTDSSQRNVAQLSPLLFAGRNRRARGKTGESTLLSRGEHQREKGVFLALLFRNRFEKESALQLVSRFRLIRITDQLYRYCP